MCSDRSNIFRFVEDALDDYEGELTRNGVTNFHGIVKFEIARVYTLDTNEPTTGWDKIDPLVETYSFRDKLADGNVQTFYFVFHNN